MKKQQENALLSHVYAILETGILAREFQFDSDFQIVNLTSMTENAIRLLTGDSINIQIDIKGN